VRNLAIALATSTTADHQIDHGALKIKHDAVAIVFRAYKILRTTVAQTESQFPKIYSMPSTATHVDIDPTHDDHSDVEMVSGVIQSNLVASMLHEK
jgi:hypothetical protein